MLFLKMLTQTVLSISIYVSTNLFLDICSGLYCLRTSPLPITLALDLLLALDCHLLRNEWCPGLAGYLLHQSTVV